MHPGIFPFLEELILLPNRHGGIHHPGIRRYLDADVLLKIRINDSLLLLGPVDFLPPDVFSRMDFLHDGIHPALFLLTHILFCHSTSLPTSQIMSFYSITFRRDDQLSPPKEVMLPFENKICYHIHQQ